MSEVKPVAWMSKNGALLLCAFCDEKIAAAYGWVPLYTHPPSAQAAAAGEVPVWMVENQRISFDYGRPNWLFRQETKQSYGKPPINVFGWTSDPAKALRFPRKQDAEDALLIASCYVADGPTFKHAFVSEHIFHGPDQAAIKAQG